MDVPRGPQAARKEGTGCSRLKGDSPHLQRGSASSSFANERMRFLNSKRGLTLRFAPLGFADKKKHAFGKSEEYFDSLTLR
jgi:hypothetical protein